jgi:excinuclease ABC subunit C
MPALLDKVKSFPQKPGVYLMKAREGDGVIYVGKAKNLLRRVRSYFKPEHALEFKTSFLMKRVGDIDFIETANEKEALLLENTLIKRYQPRYNIHLRDDKNYVSIRLSMKHPFPQIGIVRKRKKNDMEARTLGPYTSTVEARKALKTVQQLFGIRTCSNAFFNSRTRPCIDFDMGLCSGPCAQKIGKEEYQRTVFAATDFLKGYRQTTLEHLREEMGAAAERLEFEQAALLRNRIRTIEQSFDRQNVILAKPVDFDVIYLHASGQMAFVALLQIREGKLIGTQKFSFQEVLSRPSESLSQFMQQYYTEQADWPKEIIVSQTIRKFSTLNELLDIENPNVGSRVPMTCPQRGEKKKLLDLACHNAQNVAKEWEREQSQEKNSLADLQAIFHLSKIPQKIECFDISNIGGEHAVGSKVAFEEGKPDKTHYRRYKIRTVEGANDFAMIYEVLYRRFTHAAEDPLPDFVLIDGGKGQLRVAAQLLIRELNIKDCFLAAIAKERRKEGEKISVERFFIPGRKNPIVVNDRRPGRLLLIRLRDEAHRFAISYYRKRHRQKLLLS